MENEIQKKPRILCLHGFRMSGQILKSMASQWPESVLQKLELVFIDAPYQAQGKSGVEGIYDPPYYEWFQSNEDYTEYYNFEKCVAFLEDYMLKNGPFDGLLGFSQGAVLSTAIPGMQMEGVGLAKVPKIKFLIIISGAKFGGASLIGLPKLAAKAFSSLLTCPSLHFIGEMDITKNDGIELLNAFVDPIVVYHLEGHTIPRLDEKSIETFLGFIKNNQELST